VLSHDYWQTRYGGEAGVLAQTVMLDGRPFEIIGVTPAGFFGTEVGRSFDVAVPLCAEPIFREAQSGLGKPDTWFLDLMARLKPGWTAERAQAQLESMSPGVFSSTVSPRYNAEKAKNYAAFIFTATAAPTGVSGLRRAYATQLWVLLGATALVLLITCANLANLMLARATAREREIAVRLAIGASRARIVRQMLSESLLVAALGAALGAGFARWFSQALVAFLSTENSRLFVDLSPDWRVFGFIALLAVLACLLFGLSPALKATRANPARSMQSGGRSSTDAGERFAVRRGLVVVQVALSTVLIVGALLFARSLQNLVTLDPGFRHDGIVAINVDLRRVDVSALTGNTAVAPTIIDRVRAVPGVSGAAEVDMVPLSGSVWNNSIVVDAKKQDGVVNFNRVGPEYFKTMETPLLAGRAFGPEDRLGATPTAIVNESFAKKYFGTGSPIGRTFQIEATPGQPQPAYQVVGLVKDTKYIDLREDFGPIGYFPASQQAETGPFVDLIIRTTLPTASVTPSLTRAIREVLPGSTVSYELVRTYARDSLVTERLMASLSGFFGVLAMLIATIGLYGVMSYMVSKRRVEIGIRMALGANPGRMVRMVLQESTVLFVAGALIGSALAVVASRWAANLLFALKPWDPFSITVAVGLLGSVSLLAAWIPARRASRVAPTVALRAD
jgi:predicted permease